jgi:hypothetical protein
MATRRAPITTEHVTALNLIEIDFHGKREVLRTCKAYFENLSIYAKDGPRLDRAFQERPALLAKLLHAIAKALHYRLEQLDIMAGGYTPQGFYDDLQRQRDMQAMLSDLLLGRRPLLIKYADKE